jgi:hypothetical protein
VNEDRVRWLAIGGICGLAFTFGAFAYQAELLTLIPAVTLWLQPWQKGFLDETLDL